MPLTFPLYEKSFNTHFLCSNCLRFVLSWTTYFSEQSVLVNDERLHRNNSIEMSIKIRTDRITFVCNMIRQMWWYRRNESKYKIESSKHRAKLWMRIYAFQLNKSIDLLGMLFDSIDSMALSFGWMVYF